MVGTLGILGGGATIAILIKAIDQFSGVFKRVNAGMLAIGVAAVAVGIAMLRGFGKAIVAASALQEQTAKFETVMGEALPTANKFVKELQDGFLLSELAAKRALSGFQDLFVPMGMAREEAAKLSGEITKLALDVASFNDVPVQQALDDFSSALVGMSRPVRKYGILVDEARLKAEAFAAGIGNIRQEGEKFVGELTQQEKVLVRIKVLFKDTADAQGDIARTAESFANSVRQLEASWEDFMTNAGNPFIELAAKAVRGITFLIDSFNDLREGQKKAITIVVALIAVLTLLAGIILIITSLSGALAVLWSPITLIVLGTIAAVAALIAIFVILSKKWDKFGILTKILLLVLLPMVTIPILILKNWDILKVGLAKIWNAIIKFSEMAINTLLIQINMLIDAFNLILSLFTDLRVEKLKVDFSGALIDIEGLNKVKELKEVQKEITKEIDKQAELAKKLQGLRVITIRDPTTGKTTFGDVFNPLKFRKEEFQSRFAFEQAKRGGGIEINIENVNGLDPDEVSAAIEFKLRNIIS